MKEASLSIIEDTKAHKYLMIRHQRGINKGYVNFPGGKKEVGEDMRACVIRETLEETGLTVKIRLRSGILSFRVPTIMCMFLKARNFPVS